MTENNLPRIPRSSVSDFLAFVEGWLQHACIDNLICSQRNFGRTGGRSERGLSSRLTDIASLQTFSIRFSKAGCVWITQVSIVAGVGSPLSFLKRKCPQRLSIAERWSWIWSARIDVRGRDEHALKLQ